MIVWLLTLSLLVHLTAAAGCIAGQLSDSFDLAGAANPFPICHHSGAVEDGASQHRDDRKSPMQEHAHCPLCAACGHVVLPPTTASNLALGFSVAIEAPPLPRPSFGSVARNYLAAPPRGPPRLA